MNAAYAAAEARAFARYALEPRSRILALDEPALHLRALEIGSGEPVLFLHGFGLCSAYWASLIAHLPSDAVGRLVMISGKDLL